MSETTFVIVAHPEPRSFTGSWARASLQASEELGHTVLYSDLVTDGFNPVESALCYDTAVNGTDAEPFDPLKAQERAAQSENLPTDVASEMQKILDANRLIIHFPLWWFGPPAILKGWLDRCLVHGALHNVDERFDRGRCQGKQVLFCVSTGASADECAYSGKEADVEMLLWPLAYTFRYLGFTILKPQLAHAVHGYFEGIDETDLQARLTRQLDEHKRLIQQFNDQPLMQFNADSDFDAKGTLNADAPSHSAFIRHKK